MITEADRLTQPDWCNAPQPGNWRNACMRCPGHEGDHAVRKDYRLSECLAWPNHYPVRSTYSEHFPDLWHPDHDMVEPPEEITVTFFWDPAKSDLHNLYEALRRLELNPDVVAFRGDGFASPTEFRLHVWWTP